MSLRLQALQQCLHRPQHRVVSSATSDNSELNITTLEQYHKEYPSDGSHFAPCEWKADEWKSLTWQNRFGKTYAEMKQVITSTIASPPMTDDEQRILIAIAMQESDNMDSSETGQHSHTFLQPWSIVNHSIGF